MRYNCQLFLTWIRKHLIGHLLFWNSYKKEWNYSSWFTTFLISNLQMLIFLCSTRGHLTVTNLFLYAFYEILLTHLEVFKLPTGPSLKTVWHWISKNCLICHHFIFISSGWSVYFPLKNVLILIIEAAAYFYETLFSNKINFDIS